MHAINTMEANLDLDQLQKELAVMHQERMQVLHASQRVRGVGGLGLLGTVASDILHAMRLVELVFVKLCPC